MGLHNAAGNEGLAAKSPQNVAAKKGLNKSTSEAALKQVYQLGKQTREGMNRTITMEALRS
jgi:hypothetical protein